MLDDEHPPWRAFAIPENAGRVEPATLKTRYSRELLDETKRLWSKRYGRAISDEEAREIIQNVTGYFQVVFRWLRDGRIAEIGTRSPEESGDLD